MNRELNAEEQRVVAMFRKQEAVLLAAAREHVKEHPVEKVAIPFSIHPMDYALYETAKDAFTEIHATWTKEKPEGTILPAFHAMPGQHLVSVDHEDTEIRVIPLQ